jgi:hypothetical protein
MSYQVDIGWSIALSGELGFFNRISLSLLWTNNSIVYDEIENTGD